LKGEYEQFFVAAGEHKVNTIKMGSGPPLVMVHGFGGGVGLWVSNLDELSKNYTGYAIDLMGFGRSSRNVSTGLTEIDAEKYFLDGLEQWRSSMGLTKFTLLGHSLGAFLSACYTINNPLHVSKLILADPWGVPKKTSS